MDIPIEIPVDEEKPRRRGVPPRFEAMLKKKEAAAASPGIVEEQPKVENTPTDGRTELKIMNNRYNDCSTSSSESDSRKPKSMFIRRSRVKSEER